MGSIRNSIRSMGFVAGWLLLLYCYPVSGIGVNWGTQATHPLPASTVVRMLKDNGFDKVKLFDADNKIFNALSNSGIQVMVGIPNEMLYTLANDVQAAEDWVTKNISTHVSSNSVDIRYVAVGNEPFLSTFNGTFLNTTLPALQNIQAALIRAGLSARVKVTVPLNADVYESQSNLPSEGDFRSDIRDLMVEITKFLSDNGAPFTVNIYPFISLYSDSNFPIDFAFFDNNNSAPINDGGRVYQNVFEANYDTLVWALQKNGFGNLPIIVGEVGWPTDGDKNANLIYAQRFNQGFMSHVNGGQGTPMRAGPLDAYLFSLIDEDAKSVQPGNFERHWGLFYIDGKPKYQLNLVPNKNGLVAAKGVHYLAQKWCVMSPSASLDDPQVPLSVSYACANADCTSLGYGASCSNLDARGNVSYAFNTYYQRNNQLDSACRFPNLSVITTSNPSVGDCQFRIMIQTTSASVGGRIVVSITMHTALLVLVFLFLLTMR
ncbi:hypothetical protein Pint_12676 [Pistacia integerrima]|uniref:Uncharacterized protein n=1 Tax=Pistacia integerrima TaxID=434235 RepID=A0ACC0YBN4_9ROSI|nr:hypothetical protein Pint_12676 [Pistacia integerrima]